MAETTARTKKEGKHYEILVDEEEAFKYKRGEGNINSAVLTDAIFHNLKSGEHASTADLEKNFGTSDPTEVAEKIIKNGEIVRTTESKNTQQDQKYKQVIDFLVRNATSPEGRPYTPNRIEKALHEAHVNVKNKPIDTQVTEIVDQLSKVLPIKIETKTIRLTIPAIHTVRAYSTIKEFITKEEWQNNGDLVATLNIPSGLVMDFYDKINSDTQGSVLSEEIKK